MADEERREPADADAAAVNQTSFVRLIVIGVYSFCRLSFTSAPFALSEGGWRSLLILICLSLLAYATSLLLGSCLNGDMNSYEDLGEAAFTKWGSIAIRALTFLLCYATCIGSLILQNENLVYIFPRKFGGTMSVGLLITLIVLVILIFLACVNRLPENPWMSAAGVLLMLLVIICMLLMLAFKQVVLEGKHTEPFNTKYYDISIGFYVYFFTGHGVLPVIYAALPNKEHFGRLVFLIILLSTCLYIAVASLGYAMFGDTVKQSFTLNLPKDTPLTYLTIFCTTVDHVIRYMLNILPVLDCASRVLDKWLPQNVHVALRYLLQGLVNLTLMSLPILPVLYGDIYVELVNLSGATAGVLLAFVVPVACFVRLTARDNVTLFQVCCAIVALLAGGIGAVLTIYKSVAQHLRYR